MIIIDDGDGFILEHDCTPLVLLVYMLLKYLKWYYIKYSLHLKSCSSVSKEMGLGSVGFSGGSYTRPRFPEAWHQSTKTANYSVCSCSSVCTKESKSSNSPSKEWTSYLIKLLLNFWKAFFCQLWGCWTSSRASFWCSSARFGNLPGRGRTLLRGLSISGKMPGRGLPA